jgi:hypothetical protein
MSSNQESLMSSGDSRDQTYGAGGETTAIIGRGAERWPTTEAVMSDLWDIRRQVKSNPQSLKETTSDGALQPGAVGCSRCG